MKTLATFLALFTLPCLCLAANPTPAQLQQLLADTQDALTKQAADVAALQVVAKDQQAVTDAQTVLALATSAEATAASDFSAACQKIQADVASWMQQQAALRAQVFGIPRVAPVLSVPATAIVESCPTGLCPLLRPRTAAAAVVAPAVVAPVAVQHGWVLQTGRLGRQWWVWR
jgi:hypothetical protein